MSSSVANFWAKVNRTDSSSCWPWQGAVSSNGYGSTGWDGKICGAHRIAAFLAGIIATPFWNPSRSDKTLVLHKCDNPLCCNPNHLFAGNFQDNSDDCKNKNRLCHQQGEKHHSAKLSDAIAESIRHAFSCDLKSVSCLAKEYGVSTTAIGKIVYGKSYKKAGGPISLPTTKQNA
jgi:hypothetical protein